MGRIFAIIGVFTVVTIALTSILTTTAFLFGESISNAFTKSELKKIEKYHSKLYAYVDKNCVSGKQLTLEERIEIAKSNIKKRMY